MKPIKNNLLNYHVVFWSLPLLPMHRASLATYMLPPHQSPFQITFLHLQNPQTPKTAMIDLLWPVHLRQKDINPINSKHWKTPFKLYYQRPTTPDLLLEERGENNFKSFSANNIYEWNIDAQTEYNIMNTLQHMTIVATAYQTSHEC